MKRKGAELVNASGFEKIAAAASRSAVAYAPTITRISAGDTTRENKPRARRNPPAHSTAPTTTAVNRGPGNSSEAKNAVVRSRFISLPQPVCANDQPQ